MHFIDLLAPKSTGHQDQSSVKKSNMSIKMIPYLGHPNF